MYETPLRMYETTIIITPDLDNSEFGNIVAKFSKLIADHGGEILNQEIWGFRKLAYPINKKNSGYYVFTEFKGSVEFISRLEREYEYDDRIIRYLTVKLDKHAIAYNLKRRDRLKNKMATTANAGASDKDTTPEAGTGKETNSSSEN